MEGRLKTENIMNDTLPPDTLIEAALLTQPEPLSEKAMRELCVPPLSAETIQIILQTEFPDLTPEAVAALAGIFLDLQKKSLHSEISTKAIDFRGLLGAIRAMKRGLAPRIALKMGIVDRVFDEFEKELVQDVIDLRLPQSSAKMFTS